MNDFDYDLPKEKIALFPSNERSESKLLFADSVSEEIRHLSFGDIVGLVPGGSTIVFNNTKVIAARIPAKKITGGKAEILCTDPVAPSRDPQITMQAKGRCSWKSVLGGRAIKPGCVLLPQNDKASLNIEARVIEKNGMEGIVEFSWEPSKISFSEILAGAGKVPLPPYIDRENEESDRDRYQTVYAKNDGSVAAPTAGLHFTAEILSELKNNAVDFCNMTLHVGPGTFRPVSDDDVSKHKMHEEQIVVTKSQIEQLHESYKAKKEVTCVGTTSLRTLETLYILGKKLYLGLDDNFTKTGDGISFALKQEEAYMFIDNKVSPRDAFNSLLSVFENNQTEEIYGYTSLFIVPGYPVNTVNGLITNFHLPKSTLLMLVSAFAGDKFRKEIYRAALTNDYRFLSYGDSSYIKKQSRR